MSSYRAFPNPVRLAEQVAVVTGGAAGIGRACAERYAAEGAAVVIADVDESGAEVAAGIRDRGGRANFLSTDVRDPAALERLRGRAVSKFGALTIWHNNAFRSTFRPIDQQTLEEFDATVAVSLRPYWYGAKLAAAWMLSHGGGVILNTASVQSYFGEPGFSAYQAVKGAVLNMTRAIGRECAPTVRAAALAPGLVLTEANAALPAATLERVKADIPAGRGARPEEIAGLAAFLVSPEADYITATGVIIDGGYLGI